MKKTKKGFSLAELLIALGIVSIVATLGFSIAKRGIENAYDIYIYTGYRGITTAIGNATSRNIYIYEDMAKFKTDIAYTFNGKVDSQTGKVVASNGILYSFGSLGTLDEKNYYSVIMEVPAAKKDGVNRRTVCLVFAPDDNWGILVPIDYSGCTSTIPKLYDRMDLLPFYLDDGSVGRKPPSMNYEYQPRKFITARQAICQVYGAIKIPTQTPEQELSCEGIAAASSPSSGIKLTHPKKAN